MGQQTLSEGVELDATTLARRVLAGRIAFVDLEERFISLLSQDINKVKPLAQMLERHHGQLPPHHEAKALWLIARYTEVCSQHRLTIRWARAAKTRFEHLGLGHNVHQCLRLLGSAYHFLGNYEKAVESFEAILAEDGIANLERLKVTSNLGVMEYRRHNYGPALRYFSQAGEILKQEPQPRLEAILRHNMANTQVCINAFSEAESNYQTARTLFQEQGLTLYEAMVLQAFGNLYTILGQFYMAEQRLIEAREGYARAGDDFGAALCDFDLYRMFILLNRFDEALDQVEELVLGFKRLGRVMEQGQVCYHAIEAALALGEEELAGEYLDRAMRLFRREKNTHYLARCDLYRARLAARRNRGKRALFYLDRAVQAFVATGHKELELIGLLDAVRYRKGRATAAEITRLKNLIKVPLSPRVRTEALLVISQDWYDKRQFKRSCDLLFEAIGTIEAERASIAVSSQRKSFFNDKAEIYGLLIERLYQWGHAEAKRWMFRVIELSRSRLMTEKMSREGRAAGVLNRDEPLLLEMDREHNRLNQLNRKLQGLLTQDQTSALEMKALQESKQEVRRRINLLRGRMRDSARLGLYFPIDLDVGEIQKLMPEGHLLVCFFLGQSGLYRLTLGKQTLHTRLLPCDKRFLREINQLQATASMIHPAPNRLMRLIELSDRLSEVLVPPQVASCRHVTYVFHRELHRFPAALLRFRGRFLLETNTLNQCQNLSMYYFALKRASRPRHRPLFYFSDDAADPRAPERGILGELYPGAVCPDRWRAEDVQEAWPNADVIHFAGHCAFNRHHPDESYLLLGGAKVFLRDLAQLRLAQPFINLASCRSGAVVVAEGNEPRGFVISLFAAGAGQVLASQWDINDEKTGDWMAHFYRELPNGAARAYQAACLAMMKQEPDPHYWAGFCLLGRPCSHGDIS
ncbi:CHAT domain-containing protein [Acanthopleuribacter pedis]|uniref:CHAT domain-containing protein n=1 Tax=Acanthopleuribacter pedis TaxID=442870 RepID=A0A8J7QCQ8_9BACT|nr:CHAT domain-containing tetratricopeptide repeat protein [Acanthopleuribacter pedis]MBO1323296.1 CHAT domain-containing protein [Acanthopleuribacter pedis]